MKTTILAIAIMFAGLPAVAQKTGPDYHWGVGLKYHPAAISIKKYTETGDALEFLLSKYDEGRRLAVLYEVSPKLNRSGTIHAVIGPGLHVGFWDSDIHLNSYTHNPIIGADFIFGLEFKVSALPLAFQVDYQPGADLVGNNEFFKNWGGLVIRYTW